MHTAWTFTLNLSKHNLEYFISAKRWFNWAGSVLQRKPKAMCGCAGGFTAIAIYQLVPATRVLSYTTAVEHQQNTDQISSNTNTINGLQNESSAPNNVEYFEIIPCFITKLQALIYASIGSRLITFFSNFFLLTRQQLHHKVTNLQRRKNYQYQIFCTEML